VKDFWKWCGSARTDRRYYSGHLMSWKKNGAVSPSLRGERLERVGAACEAMIGDPANKRRRENSLRTGSQHEIERGGESRKRVDRRCAGTREKVRSEMIYWDAGDRG